MPKRPWRRARFPFTTATKGGCGSYASGIMSRSVPWLYLPVNLCEPLTLTRPLSLHSLPRRAQQPHHHHRATRAQRILGRSG